jgi:hypothetical protein
MQENSSQNFLSKQNVGMLLDIIMDGDIFKNQPTEVLNATEGVFYNNINGFYKNSKKDSYSLIDLNKQYIMLILKYVESDLIRNDTIRNDTIRNDTIRNDTIRNDTIRNDTIRNDTIRNDTIQKPRQQKVTFEDIQNDRRSQFDKDLNAKQSDFTSAMTRPVPPVPKFSDTNIDEPISEMELAIKQMTEQRKYDVEQITQNFGGKTIAPPIQTSINSVTVNSQDRHYIKIDKQDATFDATKIIDLETEDDASFEKNLFSKLHFHKHPVSSATSLSQSLEKEDNNSILSKLQQNVFDLRQNMETVNRDIVKILELCSQLSMKV